MRPMWANSRPDGCRIAAASASAIWCGARKWQWISCSARSARSVQLLVKSITFEAEDIISLDLRPSGPEALPPFTAGAHIDVALANGLSRSYSLANPQSETHRYVIGVQKDATSRGGSRLIHEAVRV